MKKNSLSKEELRILRSKLPEGAIDNLATEFELAPASVSQILYKPQRHRDDLIGRALEIAETNLSKAEDRVDEFKKRIAAIA